MSKIKVMPFGSCRIYRPFKSSAKGFTINNIFSEIEIIHPRCGFFHSIAEINQTLEYMSKGISETAKPYMNYLYRKEPPKTTPDNVFSENILSEFVYPVDIRDADMYLLEISSLECFFHEGEGLYFHWNPNFLGNVSYSDIYPKGYYETYKPELNVNKKVLSDEEVYNAIFTMQRNLNYKPIIITTHIHDKNVSKRRILYETIKSAVDKFDEGVYLINNARIFESRGYRYVEGERDVHHLSLCGEIELGNTIQNKVLTLGQTL